MATGMERANAFRDLRNGLLPPAFVSAWPAEVGVGTEGGRVGGEGGQHGGSGIEAGQESRLCVS